MGQHLEVTKHLEVTILTHGLEIQKQRTIPAGLIQEQPIGVELQKFLHRQHRCQITLGLNTQ